MSEQNCVYIEHCTHCNCHQWCTSHDEKKYHDFFQKVKYSILQTFPSFSVLENQVKISPETIITCDDPNNPIRYRNSQGIIVTFPQLGSFEVVFMNKKIFSKLALGIWPNSLKIVQKIKDAVNGLEVTDYSSITNEEKRKLLSKSFSRSKSRDNNQKANQKKHENDNGASFIREKPQTAQKQKRVFPKIYEHVGKYPAYFPNGFFVDKGFMQNFSGKNSFVKIQNINESVEKTQIFQTKNVPFKIKNDSMMDQTQLLQQRKQSKDERRGSLKSPNLNSNNNNNNQVIIENNGSKTPVKEKTPQNKNIQEHQNNEQNFEKSMKNDKNSQELKNKEEVLDENPEPSNLFTKQPQANICNNFNNLNKSEKIPLEVENLDQNIDKKNEMTQKKLSKEETISTLIKEESNLKQFSYFPLDKPVVVSETFVVNYKEKSENHEYSDEFEKETDRYSAQNNDSSKEQKIKSIEEEEPKNNKNLIKDNQLLKTPTKSFENAKENLVSNNENKEDAKKSKKKQKKPIKTQSNIESPNNQKEIASPMKENFLTQELSSSSPKKLLYEYNVDFFESSQEKNPSQLQMQKTKTRELLPINSKVKSLEPISNPKSSGKLAIDNFGVEKSFLDSSKSIGKQANDLTSPGKSFRDHSSPSKLLGKSLIGSDKSPNDSPNKFNRLEPLNENGIKKQGRLTPLKGNSEERPITQEGKKRKKHILDEIPNRDLKYEIEKFCSLNIPIKKSVKKKITITNDENSVANVKIKCDDPERLVIVNPENEIEANSSVKISLIFKEYPVMDQILYTISIHKENKPWQKVMLTANYVN